MTFTANATAIMPTGAVDRPPASFTATCSHMPSLCDMPAPIQQDPFAPPPAGQSPAAQNFEVAAGDLNTAARLATQTLAATFRAEESNALHVAISINLKPADTTVPAASDFDDSKALKLLQAVNGDVNGAMAPSMSLLVNPADEWTPAVRTRYGLVGDCKSFAAEKRRRLIEAGFPADRLFYAVVFREDIGLHALLMAHLDQGDYALDSRQPLVTRWYEAAYIYVQRQALGDQMQWTNLIVAQNSVAPILLARNGPPAAISGAGSR